MRFIFYIKKYPAKRRGQIGKGRGGGGQWAPTVCQADISKFRDQSRLI